MTLRFAVRLSCVFGLLAVAALRCPSADEPPVPDAELEREAKIVERYLSLVERNPREGTSFDRAYGFYVEQGRIEELVDRYRSRVETDETDGAAWMILGLIEARRGEDAAAINAFTQASEHRSDDPLAAYYLGKSLSIAGRPERAIAAFEEAISRKPARRDLPSIFVALGRLQGRFGNTEEASQIWERLEAAFPGDLRVKAEIAAVLENEGRVELALERYVELAKAADDEYQKVTYTLKAAEMKVRLSNTDGAIADYEALLTNLNPDNWLYREVRRGIENVYLRTDDLDGLASYYETWIEQHPEDVRAMSRLAGILGDLGRADDARTWFDKAVRLAPSDVRLRRDYITSLRRGGKTKAALQQFEALDEALPNNPDVIRDWGTVYLEDKSLSEDERKAKAAQIWKRLLTGEDEDPVVTAQVADWFRQAGLTDQALALYAKAIEQAPDDPRYLEYLGEYQHQLGKPEQAVATWKKLAAGENRTPANLVRLADVLSGFGYKEEAIAVFREADNMNLEFAARLQFAELLREREKYDDALRQIAKAESLAESDEERQQALLDRIETDRDASRLEERVVELKKQVEENPSARASLTLALYLDASRDAVGAIDAARTAVRLDPGSIPAQQALARMADSSGQLAVAATAFRKLAALDRRGRTEYLKWVAGLERRLGKVEEAMATGREVLASSPGSPDAYSFYADLCFQAGRTEEGFDALRRAVRLAPDDAGPLLRLAAVLAEQFRTDEAVELYWQAFETAESFDDKLPIVGRLAELYLRTDRFEELIDRLNRTARGDGRETKLLIAQAHQTVGDLGKALEALTALLVENPRDTGLLGRLSALAEQNNDYETALRYQREIVELAPADRAAKARLARLYLASDIDAGDEFWDSLVAEGLDHVETISLIDAMLSAEKYEDALRLTNRGLREKPEDWELLYRRAFALFKLGKDYEDDRTDDAAAAFERLLALDLPDDTKAAKLAARNTQNAPPTASAASLSMSFPKVLQRIQSVQSSKAAFGFVQQRNVAYMGMAASQQTWTPTDYGSARLAVVGWLEKEAPECEFMADLKQAVKDEHAGARTLWDWFYLVSYRANRSAERSTEDSERDRLDAARRLAKLGDPDGAWIYLFQLAQSRQTQRSPNDNRPKDLEPLAEEELDLMLACYEQARNANTGPYASYLTAAVARELGRAGQQQKARTFVDEMLASTDDPQTIMALLSAAEGAEDDVIVDAVFERLETLPPDKLSSTSGGGQTISKLMRTAWDEDRRDKTLELLDRQLDLAGRRLESPRRRSGLNISSSTNYGVTIWKKNGEQEMTIVRSSQMNGYLGPVEITLLMNAALFFKEEKAIDDLVAHLTKRAEAATGPQAAMSYLAVADVHKYANVSPDELQRGGGFGISSSGTVRRTGTDSETEPWQNAALAATQKAMEVAPKDYALRLTLAKMLRDADRNAEAYALLEKVEPFDLDQLRDRELLVLEIAPALSKIERARDAAKRLFGLRLDSKTQIQLAKSMQRIGMAGQAEAVMARLRSRGAGDLSTQIQLLRHYKAQGDEETAVEIARAIIRSTSGSTGGRRTVEDSYREDAVRVLKEAGKLDSLINDARRRAKAVPGSIEAQQQLAELLTTAGKTAEAAEVLKQASKNRPDDADLKYRLAGQMIAMGKADDGVELYAAALKANPQLMNQDFYEMRQAFENADREKDFLKLLGEIDYSKSGQISYAANTASNKLRDEELKDEALALLDSLLSNNPDQRAQVFQHIRDDEAWNNPKIVGHALALLNEDGTSLTWQELSDISTWSPGGKIVTLFNSLSKAAQSDARKKEFQSAIAEMAGKNPQWQPGQALLAIVEANQEKYDEAKKRIRGVIDDEQAPITDLAAWAVAVELAEHEPLRGLAIELAQQAAAGNVQSTNSFQYQPEALLVDLYAQAGKKRKARELILTEGMVLTEQNYSNPQYDAYQEMQHYVGVGDKLVELGYPIDALRIYDQYAGDPERVEAAKQQNSYYLQQLKEGREKALKQIKPANVAAFLDAASKEAPNEESPSFDLVLTVTGDDFSKLTVNSVIIAAINTALGPDGMPKKAEENQQQADAEATESIRSDIEALSKSRPDDLAVQIIAAVAAYSLGDLEAARKATERVATLAASVPESKTQASQQSEHARLQRVSLWMVAREAARHDETRALADGLADRAVAAAESLSDPRWATALLRERGQLAIDTGDRAAAKEAWSDALDLIIPPPESESTETTPQQAPKPDQEDSRTTIETLSSDGGFAVIHGATIVMTQPSSTGGKTKGRVSLEQATQALELADLAAKNGMLELSLRAVRVSLAGGRPFKIEPPSQNTAFPVTAFGGSGDFENIVQIDNQVAERLLKVGDAWREQEADPAAVYDVLLAVLLPADRPDETLVYPPPLNENQANAPKSAARMLVNWAERAGKLDDLTDKLGERSDAKPSAVSVLVLRVLTAYKLDDMDAARVALAGLKKKQAVSGSTRHAELACHAALPGLLKDKVRKTAREVLTQVVARYAMFSNDQPLGWLSFKLAEYDFWHGRPDEAVQLLDDYLAALPRIYENYSGNYDEYRRREVLLKISQMLGRSGQSTAALDRLGEALEIPIYTRYGGNTSIDKLFASSLARRLAADRGREAYNHLKAWTLPGKGHGEVRHVTGLTAAAVPPREFGINPDPCREAFGIDFNPPVTGTAAALVAMAKWHGQLDELAAELDPLVEKKVKNAAALSILVHVARGTGGEAAEQMNALADDLIARPVEQVDFKNEVQLLLLVAMAAATNDTLRSDAARIAQHLSVPATGKGHGLHSAARFLVAMCQALEAGVPAGEALLRDDFGPWRAARVARQQDRRGIRIPAVWVVRDGVARQAAGSESNLLVFRYPLSGSFDIVLEAWDASFAESFPGFNGLTYQSYAWNKKSVTLEVAQWGQGKIPIENKKKNAYATYRIRVRPGEVRCLVGGQELHVDKTSTAGAPFLTLDSSFSRAGWFREVKIEGDPVIPREVRLLDGDRLDGWVTSFFAEAKPQRPGVSKGGGLGFREDGGQPIWSVDGGVLTGRIPPDGLYHQSWISYHRPLWDGESIEYEFFHDGGHGVVHPALGRVAFLLERDGVRLHWMADDWTGHDWTGLPPDNSVPSPESCRGPERLPLKDGQWNRVRLAIDDGTLTIQLNGVLVFERALGDTESRLFGLYRDAAREVQIRNVVLRGDWPERLDEETKAGLLATVPASSDERLIHLEHEIITEEHMPPREP